MNEPTLFTLACIIVGVVLIAKTMGSSFIGRQPVSAAMLYLGVGIAIGPWGFNLLRLNAFTDVVLLERLTELALLVSLFTAGMKLELPLNDRRWRLPVQLASVSMVSSAGARTPGCRSRSRETAPSTVSPSPPSLPGKDSVTGTERA